MTEKIFERITTMFSPLRRARYPACKANRDPDSRFGEVITGIESKIIGF
jgi:hypothetical protein